MKEKATHMLKLRLEKHKKLNKCCVKDGRYCGVDALRFHQG